MERINGGHKGKVVSTLLQGPPFDPVQGNASPKRRSAIVILSSFFVAFPKKQACRPPSNPSPQETSHACYLRHTPGVLTFLPPPVCFNANNDHDPFSALHHRWPSSTFLSCLFTFQPLYYYYYYYYVFFSFLSAAGKGQICLPTAEKNAQFKKLKALRENTTCFDCPNTRPTWASVTHGMLIL
jgi:hypothetical protein